MDGKQRERERGGEKGGRRGWRDRERLKAVNSLKSLIALKIAAVFIGAKKSMSGSVHS